MSRWVPTGVQLTGLLSLVVGFGLVSVAAAFVTAGVGLLLWGVALERGGD
jgi:type IV secretory pathway TrbD component